MKNYDLRIAFVGVFASLALVIGCLCTGSNAFTLSGVVGWQTIFEDQSVFVVSHAEYYADGWFCVCESEYDDRGNRIGSFEKRENADGTVVDVTSSYEYDEEGELVGCRTSTVTRFGEHSTTGEYLKEDLSTVDTRYEGVYKNGLVIDEVEYATGSIWSDNDGESESMGAQQSFIVDNHYEYHGNGRIKSLMTRNRDTGDTSVLEYDANGYRTRLITNYSTGKVVKDMYDWSFAGGRPHSLVHTHTDGENSSSETWSIVTDDYGNITEVYDEDGTRLYLFTYEKIKHPCANARSFNTTRVS